MSRVLNGRPGVSEATRSLVLGAAGTLGYRPPRKAAQGELVGVVAQDSGVGAGPSLADSVLTAFHRRGYLPVLCAQAHGAPREEPAARKLLEYGASGLVFLGGDHTDTTANHDLYQSLTDEEVPYVLVGGAAFTARSACVSNDDVGGVRKAVRHLAELGHARIGMISGTVRFLTSQRRRDGFLAALRELGIPAEEAESRIEHVHCSEGGGFCAAEILMERGCTALICDSDPLALGAMQAARARSLVVPDQLSLVVLGDSTTARHLVPALTVVSPPAEKMAESIADALMMAISGTPLTSLELLFLPDLITRDSTGRAPLF